MAWRTRRLRAFTPAAVPTDELARQGVSPPRAERIVVLTAVLVGLVALRWSFDRGLPLLITDAQSHLVIARRVVDGPGAGIGQLGTVWLPLPHLLLVPFVLPIAWWRSGLGAGLLGVGCLAVTCLATYRTAVRVTTAPLAGWAAVAALLCTRPLLYVHTTAMTEPVLLATVSATMAGVSAWEARGWRFSGGEIAAFCGSGAFFVVFSRYEGWAFVAAIGGYAALGVWCRRGLRRAIGALRRFASAPSAAALMWFAFNAVSFGDPLAFQRGAGSSEAQMAVRRALGALPDYHRLDRSTATFVWVTKAMCGPWLTAGAALATCVYVAGIGPRLRSRAPFAVLALGAFHILSLWTGQTFMSHEYAVRYGVVVIPFAAVMAGWAIASAAPPVRRGAAWLLGTARLPTALVGTLMICALMITQARTASTAALLHQGRLEQEKTAHIDGAARWLAARHDRGRVLIDDTASPVLLQLGLPLRDVVASFTGPDWRTATHGAPQRVARWALVNGAERGDRVAAMLRARPAGWTTVHRDGPATVYRYDPAADRGAMR